MKHVRHSNDDDVVRSMKKVESDDEYEGISFGSLSAAQKQMGKKERKEKNGKKKNERKGGKRRDESDSEDSEVSDEDIEVGGISASDSEDEIKRRVPKPKGLSKSNSMAVSKSSRHKHAPTEGSSKKPVSRIRKLEVSSKYKDSLHSDIRFDAAYGKADLQDTRKNYGFLDEYRQKEINDLKRAMSDKKTFYNLSHYEQNEIRDRLQSLKSRLDTLKNRDLEFKVLDDYKKEQMDNFRSGKQSTPYYLKKSDQRKLIQKAKFEGMRPAQREKVMERKRKRKLGREFRELEFRET